VTCSKEKAILLHGMLDGQLDAMNAVQFEEHLEVCPLCAAEYERQKQMRAAIWTSGVAHKAPDSLRLRIEAAIGPVGTGAPSMPANANRMRQRSLRTSWWISGVSLALAASLALFIALPHPRTGALEEELVDSHVRSLLASHLTDVQSSDRHTVRPWFNGKVDVAPPAVDLADKGFPLIGGRLDYIDDRVVAALVYRRNGHVINVFVRSAPEAKNSEPREISYRGYNLCRWREKGTEFWAVTDASQSELKEFEQLYSAASAAEL
jgi:anti-sigma factor RsiW